MNNQDEVRERPAMTGHGSGKLIADLRSWKDKQVALPENRTPQQIKDDAYCDGWLDGFAAMNENMLAAQAQAMLGVAPDLGCGHLCGYREPYGFVPEADCPVHDLKKSARYVTVAHTPPQNAQGCALSPEADKIYELAERMWAKKYAREGITSIFRAVNPSAEKERMLMEAGAVLLRTARQNGSELLGDSKIDTCIICAQGNCCCTPKNNWRKSEQKANTAPQTVTNDALSPEKAASKSNLKCTQEERAALDTRTVKDRSILDRRCFQTSSTPVLEIDKRKSQRRKDA